MDTGIISSLNFPVAVAAAARLWDSTWQQKCNQKNNNIEPKGKNSIDNSFNSLQPGPAPALLHQNDVRHFLK